jgi:nickel/cobalt transporter (NicO) family protein
MISTYTSDKNLPSLSALAISAVILGFSHEEEFVILSLVAGGVNPLLLMMVYALPVSVALIGITILSVNYYYTR